VFQILQNISYSKRYDYKNLEMLLNGKIKGKINDLAIRQAELDLKLKELLIKRKRLKLEEILERTRVRAYKKSIMRVCDSCESLIDSNALICPNCGIEKVKSAKTRLLEKEIVIQLFIIDNPSAESPFIKGLNTIVCPYKVFKDSKMNSLLEMFQNVNSEYSNPKLKGWDKIILPKKKCSAKIAEDILNLILTELFNETMGEEILI